MSQSIRKLIYSLPILFFSFSYAVAQNCTLDIGGKNFEMISDIFQLNTKQQTLMESLRGEFEIEVKTIEEDIQKLFDTHPQSTEAELINLSDKYKVLKNKLVNASWESDKKLLESFNPKQYERYQRLCFEAVREPIRITPVQYKDSISPE